MSLVGTRPPTVDEWDKYELHHRARLATILSFMDVFVCINDSFRCTFKSISDEALCQYTRTDSDYNNCVRCSVGIMVYQYAGFYPEKKKSGACHAGFVIKQ